TNVRVLSTNSGNLSGSGFYTKVGTHSTMEYSGTATNTSAVHSLFAGVWGQSNFSGTVNSASARVDQTGGFFTGNFSGTNTNNAVLSVSGIHAQATGSLGTTGGTQHVGGWFDVTGTADTNYGTTVEVGGATTNY